MALTDGLELQATSFDCNAELPYGMRPKLKTVIYSGFLEPDNVFVLFENLLYLIVDINQG